MEPNLQDSSYYTEISHQNRKKKSINTFEPLICRGSTTLKITKKSCRILGSSHGEEEGCHSHPTNTSDAILVGKLPRGKIKAAAELFMLDIRSVLRIWKTSREQNERGEVIDVGASKQTRIMKKKHAIAFAQIELIEKEKRQTISSLSEALGLTISRATVGRYAKQMLRHHSNAIKPLLTAPNMISRLAFSLKSLHYDFSLNTPTFKPMENTVHIDGKWFYITTKNKKYYLTPTEADPLRVTQSKNFIPKVMFMCAVSRPVLDTGGRVMFDGKIGIWPFVEEKTAQRNSTKRPRGTIELKPIQSITRQVIKDCVSKEVVRAIKQKWPSFLTKNIQIQQDNAKTHISNQDADFQQIGNTDVFEMKLVQQLANSPDCNANDLGFFNAIQSLQQKIKCKNAYELIDAVKECFNLLDPLTLNKVFLSLQSVLIEIMKIKGHNNYKTPHLKKEALFRQGILPMNLEVPEFLVRECIDYLIAEEKTEGLEILMEEMGISVPHMEGGMFDLNM